MMKKIIWRKSDMQCPDCKGEGTVEWHPHYGLNKFKCKECGYYWEIDR